jgi:tetratricopeptide (TPR) repeat protein
MTDAHAQDDRAGNPMGARTPAWALALALATVAVTGEPARAQSTDEQAQAHFQSGTLYFDRGEYEHAVREFEAAYELSGRVPLLYNLYLANERLGQYGQAASALERYLDQTEDVPTRDSLEARLATLERRAAQQAAGEDPDQGATDGAAMPLPAWIAFGVGAAGLATFAVAGGLALAEDRSLAARCGPDAGRTCTGDDVARLDRRNTTADVGLGIGVAGAVTGLVLWLVLRDRGADRRTGTAWGPWLPPGGAGLSAQGRF